ARSRGPLRPAPEGARLVAAGEGELREDLADIPLDRRQREIEEFRDLAVRVAAREQPEDVALPGRELPRVSRCSLEVRAGHAVTLRRPAPPFTSHPAT